MIYRFLALLAFVGLASCQRPSKPAPPKPKTYQSQEGSTVTLRLAPPNPVLSAKAPISITTSGPVEDAPASLKFEIQINQLSTSEETFVQELTKSHQFAEAKTISFQSEEIKKSSNHEIEISGKWTFEGQSKPATFNAEWSMDGSLMKLSMSPTFRLRDYRPLPKDAPKQMIDPRFQLDIQATLSPAQ
ncbi:hypothetical protein Rhal01_02280 [Rubritalea halochordaticola]|uniref:Lipid/polyisoprenoid-binding YceI-like domain-containing protein n=1 Tax=Rubritalea halochordaticola TaxID=714537 RepID=A0ABP9V3B7_9BACT